MTTKIELLPLPEGNVAHLISAQAAEIEALRAEVERLADALRELEERAQRDEALLRQALEALLGQRGEPDWHTGKQRENAIAALRERLGEKEQR